MHTSIDDFLRNLLAWILLSPDPIKGAVDREMPSPLECWVHRKWFLGKSHDIGLYIYIYPQMVLRQVRLFFFGQFSIPVIQKCHFQLPGL